MKKIIAMFAFALLTCSGFAQTSDLPVETEEAVKQQAKVKVETFTKYVSFIASKEYTDEVRSQYATAASNLFLGNGNEWTDADGNEQPAPSMQVSSINRNTGGIRVNTYSVSVYLRHLQYLNYTEVEVTSSRACFVGPLRKIADNRYKTSLTYVQIFVGKRDGLVVYRDTTRKTIDVYLESIGADGYQRWDIKLGDIQVNATEAV